MEKTSRFWLYKSLKDESTLKIEFFEKKSKKFFGF